MVDDSVALDDLASRLFFVVGCPRSGTSLTQHMLSMHSDISIPPETYFFEIANRTFGLDYSFESDARFERVLSRFLKDRRYCEFDFDIARFETLARGAERTWPGLFLAFGEAWREQHGVPIFGEKSPQHYLHVDRLASWYPKAKFIYLMRDPRATTLSYAKQKRIMKNVYRGMSLWLRAEESWVMAEQSLGSERVMKVHYEELVHDPEKVMREISEFLGVEFQPDMLEQHLRETSGFLPVEGSYMENTAKPIFTDSIGAWAEEASDQFIQIVEYWAGEERLRRYGYTLSGRKIPFLAIRAQLSRCRFYSSRMLRSPARKIRDRFFQSWKVR